jgi:hypothetical protein
VRSASLMAWGSGWLENSPLRQTVNVRISAPPKVFDR